MDDAPTQRPEKGEKPEGIQLDDRVREHAPDPSSKKHSPSVYFHGAWLKIKKTTRWIAPLLVVATVLLGIVGWIENRIDKAIERKLSDEAILRKIAAQSRPSLIFNAKESIIADMGAVQYVKPDDVRITKRTADGWPQHIHIGFTCPLSIPPILTSLYDSARIVADRGKGLDWEFEINWELEPGSKDDKDRLYRLEILP
jgi:hypothetical protein